MLRRLHRGSVARRLFSSSNAGASPGIIERVEDIVRTKDYEQYAVGLLMPSASRGAFYAIRALNAELATLRENTRGHDMASKLRVEWWKENVSKVFDNRDEVLHPILVALKNAHETHSLTRRYVERMLEARSTDLLRHEPHSLLPKLSDVESYAHEIQSNMLYIALEANNVKDEAVFNAATHAGIYIGLATVLRGTLYHLGKSQPCFIPTELLSSHNVSLETFYGFANNSSSDDDDGRCANVVRDIVNKAKEHLEISKNYASDRIFLSSIASSMYFEILEKCNYNLHDTAVLLNTKKNRQNVSYHGRLLYNRWRNRYY